MTEEKTKKEDDNKYKDIFKMFDKQNVGYFGVREVREVMQSYNMVATEQNIYEMVAQLDTNNNGFVTFDRFVSIFTNKIKDTEMEEEMREAFKVIDNDGNGFISAKEFNKIITQVGDKFSDSEWNQLVHELNFGKNEEINYEELITSLMSTQK
ncbi:calmodulin-like [Oppia nitens]|uniref:calmodulin-like n=1 Tax=Oppia nitens TaxID=1686743 RepID=UPI0023DBFA6B|nr:calmodulin-like [Oppia nitens]